MVCFTRSLSLWRHPRRVHCGVSHAVIPSRAGELDGVTAAPTVFLLGYSHVPQPTGTAAGQTDVHETRLPCPLVSRVLFRGSRLTGRAWPGVCQGTQTYEHRCSEGNAP